MKKKNTKLWELQQDIKTNTVFGCSKCHRKDELVKNFAPKRNCPKCDKEMEASFEDGKNRRAYLVGKLYY